MKQVRILGHLRFWSRAGGILALAQLLTDLFHQGHDVRLLVGGLRQRWHKIPPELPIPVALTQDKSIQTDLYRWADIVLTQGNVRNDPIISKRPSPQRVIYLHREQEADKWGISGANTSLVLCNSQWLYDAIKWPGDKMIIFPPTPLKEFATTRGDSITMMNFGTSKQPQLFWSLARRMRKRSFLGVKGGWAKQNIPQTLPTNVTMIPTTSDMKGEVYSKTRILLMPAPLESWGMVGVEAMASGIPVIAAPAKGSMESLGDAGVFLDPAKTEEWVKEIQRLDNPRYYRERSLKALARAKEIEQESKMQIEALASHLAQMIHPARPNDKRKGGDPMKGKIGMQAMRRLYGSSGEPRYIEPGEVFYCANEAQAMRLERAGHAYRVKPSGPTETKKAAKPTPAVVEEAAPVKVEHNIDDMRIGNSHWYFLPHGEKVQGRKKALARLEEFRRL